MLGFSLPSLPVQNKIDTETQEKVDTKSSKIDVFYIFYLGDVFLVFLKN